MNKQIMSFASPVRKISIFLAVFAVFLMFRNAGLYTVISDEYLYSKFSRLIPFSESTLPGYLYLGIFKSTAMCGQGYLNCARILNALLFTLSAPLVYLTARRFVSQNKSMLIMVLAVTGPINTYTAYFMPESAYYLAFWALIYCLTGLERDSKAGKWAACGLFFGLSALIKPHSLLFLPALLLYSILISCSFEGRFQIKALRNAAIIFFVGMGTKLGLGYLFAGVKGITLFGPLYSSIAQTTTSKLDRLINLITIAGQNLEGHILGLSLLYGLSVIAAIYTFISNYRVEKFNSKSQRLFLLVMLLLANLMVVVALFTASIVNSFAYETAYRLHMRYYNFMFPLLMLVPAVCIENPNQAGSKILRRFLAVFALVLIGYAGYTHLAPFAPTSIDSPELRGIVANKNIFYLVVLIGLVSVASWIFSEKVGLRIAVYALMPITTIVGYYYISAEVLARKTADVYDNAGIFVRQFLSDDDISKLAIVGTQPTGMYRSIFYLDNPNVSMYQTYDGNSYDLNTVAPNRKWILVIGDQVRLDPAQFQLPMPGFTLARVTGSDRVSFRGGSWAGVLAGASGLSMPESWGTWSVGDQVELRLISPLPPHFQLHITARAFGPNVGAKVGVFTEGGKADLLLTSDSRDYMVNLSNDGTGRTIIFKIPHPTSPKDLQMGEDTRQLGIGISEVRIEPLQ